MASLKRRKVVIIGSPQGYVKGLISDLIRMECKVALLTPRFEGGSVLPEIPEECRGFLWCPVDLGREETLISALDRVQEQWGAIDIGLNTVSDQQPIVESTLRSLSTLTLYPRFQIPTVVQINSLAHPDKVLSQEEWEGLRSLQSEVARLQTQYRERRFPVRLTSISLPLIEKSQYPTHQITSAFYEQIRPTQLAKSVLHFVEAGATQVVLSSRTLSQVEGLDLATELIDRALERAEAGVRVEKREATLVEHISRTAHLPVWLGVCAFVLGIWLLNEE